VSGRVPAVPLQCQIPPHVDYCIHGSHLMLNAITQTHSCTYHWHNHNVAESAGHTHSAPGFPRDVDFPSSCASHALPKVQSRQAALSPGEPSTDAQNNPDTMYNKPLQALECGRTKIRILMVLQNSAPGWQKFQAAPVGKGLHENWPTVIHTASAGWLNTRLSTHPTTLIRGTRLHTAESA
jgi:hypothetical protein